MQSTQVKLTDILPNPNNPRIIKDDKFRKLVKSIKDFPKMLDIRPIVVNDDMVVLGGNMRLKACREAGLKTVAVIRASSLTEEEQKQFIIKDNVGFGEWDWEMIANEWDETLVTEWGLELPVFDMPKEGEEEDPEDQNFFVPDCIFPSNNIFDIPTLKLDMQGTNPELPLKPYGAEKRTNGGVGTYHFYVDDYRFEAIWSSPVNILKSGCVSIVEPNLSLYDSTPISYGLFLIYKKRWISRYFQEKGIKVFADLNVSSKFTEYNRMGIPDGFNAFFTRGYTERVKYLEIEYQVAKEISGKDEPNLVVYGGGNDIRQFCADHNLTYIKDYINSN